MSVKLNHRVINGACIKIDLSKLWDYKVDEDDNDVEDENEDRETFVNKTKDTQEILKISKQQLGFDSFFILNKRISC